MLSPQHICLFHNQPSGLSTDPQVQRPTGSGTSPYCCGCQHSHRQDFRCCPQHGRPCKSAASQHALRHRHCSASPVTLSLAMRTITATDTSWTWFPSLVHGGNGRTHRLRELGPQVYPSTSSARQKPHLLCLSPDSLWLSVLSPPPWVRPLIRAGDRTQGNTVDQVNIKDIKVQRRGHSVGSSGRHTKRCLLSTILWGATDCPPRASFLYSGAL